MPLSKDIEDAKFSGEDEEVVMLDPSETAEEITTEGDVAMDSGSEEDGNDGDEHIQEIYLQNDSSAYFDMHKDSIFCIAQNPLYPNLIATGGSEGDDAEGIGYIFDATPDLSPVLPASYLSAPNETPERAGLSPIFKLEGHTDSINALTFTKPNGDFLLSAGLDGKLRAYAMKDKRWTFIGEAQEVEEINWLAACPNPNFPDTVAMGASDGSVWVFSIDAKSKEAPLCIVCSFFLHMASCTAGSWSPDGKLLATVSEEGSLYVWDVFGDGAAAGVTQGDGGSYVVGLTASDQRFAIDGGLFSVAISPNGTFLAAGGAGGSIKIVSIPRLSSETSATEKHVTQRTKNAKTIDENSKSSLTIGQAGQILADLQAQTDGVETLAFAPLPLTLLAAGSVDGSIVLYDSAHRFAVRKHIKNAHDEHSVVKVDFVSQPDNKYILTSCGMDGVVRRWDSRGGNSAANSGLLREWKGHRGNGEGGGVLDFVQGDGTRIVTAGDDGISLVFDASMT
ncbi:BgTH12-02010 [Blumeria graminis f. sp. triticale]|uniref:Bgt-521 n=3 Tax=Blumeria graminis TaxID=34373 RepID=A0A381LLH9_BLUGR|nr:hypothetical protein BGT96224_521 [Blumeria graminis f. sp. tritici 96224]CAD6501761.1 BgTH12-02010 [Blumeria graminis f. sp. triticale]VDB84409.1 Bgt-521 [Blumeria graminis f. sp. tritici]